MITDVEKKALIDLAKRSGVSLIFRRDEIEIIPELDDQRIAMMRWIERMRIEYGEIENEL